MGSWGEVEALDAQLCSHARAEAALRLQLGQVLEVLSRGGCLQLGFSSLSAYALERAELGSRWVERARCVARRLEVLPAVRAALAAGRVSWSVAELLARVATPGDELEWLQRAQGKTLRELAEWCAGGRGGAAGEPANDAAADVAAQSCHLTCTVNGEDAWLFEATRALLEALGTRTPDEQAQALLAEAQDTLLAGLPRGAIELGELRCVDAERERWRAQLRSWHRQAEVLCERHFRDCVVAERVIAERVVAERAAAERTTERTTEREAEPTQWVRAAARGCSALAGKSALELDALVRALAAAFAEHELVLARGVLQLQRLDGWRRLGYASEGQYARERLGMSRSAFLSRRALALKLEQLPELASALQAGRLGVEAALQVARVATPHTERAWVERARQRTVKHLREEVAAALVAQRLSGEGSCPPPLEAELEAYHELERAVVSGTVCRDGVVPRPAPVSSEPVSSDSERRVWPAALRGLSAWLERGVQFSAGGSQGSSSGRVKLRLRVSREVRAWWQGLEAQARRWLPAGMSWLKFLCLCLWRAWRHVLGENVAYGQVYIRDRHRCSSPVCSRRDVTPHHVVFRSAGGGDEDENVVALCTECHLFGVHGGRIRARGSVPHIEWELGPVNAPCLRVTGRERLSA